MLWKPLRFLTGGLIAALVIAFILPPVSDRGLKAADADQGREADTETIRTNAREFAAAFNKGDAKAVAAQWTEQGECTDADGTLIRGRANIEQAFAEFFKANPQAKLQVLVKAVRFPAPDVAVEEGVLRQTNSAKELPSTTMYTATHVRSGGKWQTATSMEWAPVRIGWKTLNGCSVMEGQPQGPVRDADVHSGRAEALHPRAVHDDGRRQIGIDRDVSHRPRPADRPVAVLAF